MLTVRIAQGGYDHIADRAETADVEVSVMVRRMLAYAASMMPKDWISATERREARARNTH